MVTPSNGEPLLEVSGVRKTYPSDVRAVKGLTLTAHRGETIGIVGESGSGKSTAAKLILRLVASDAGTIQFAGHDWLRLSGRELRGLRPRMQFVPQHPRRALNPRLTVAQNVAFNLIATTPGRSARRQMSVRLLERVGIERSLAERHPRALSGGQLQRVAIARALATSPDLVICDEPVSSLDKSVQAQILNLLAELQRELHTTYLFISHDLAVIEHFSDRVMVMHQGEVVDEGSPEQIWNAPSTEFTRALVEAARLEGVS